MKNRKIIFSCSFCLYFCPPLSFLFLTLCQTFFFYPHSRVRKEHLRNKPFRLGDETSLWLRHKDGCWGSDITRHRNKATDGGTMLTAQRLLNTSTFFSCVLALRDDVSNTLFHPHTNTPNPSQLLIRLNRSCLNKPEEESRPYFSRRLGTETHLNDL